MKLLVRFRCKYSSSVKIVIQTYLGCRLQIVLDFLVLECGHSGLQAGKKLIETLLERTSDDLPAGTPCFAIAFKDERESLIYSEMHSEKMVAATSSGTIESEIELWKVGA